MDEFQSSLTPIKSNIVNQAAIDEWINNT